MKILVLGSKGFIGSRLLAGLRQKGHKCMGLSKQDGLEMREIDSLIKRLDDFEPTIIMNFAAHVGSVHYGMKVPADILHDNMLLLLNLYKSVAKVCPTATIINPVSNCSYPMDAKVQIESEWWCGRVHPSALAYGSTRRMIYVLAECYKQQFGVPSKNFILPGIYGPGNHAEVDRVHALDGIIIRMIQAKHKNESCFKVWGSGNPIREWCYIDDLVSIMIDALSLKCDLTYPVNIGQKNGFSIKELTQMIADLLNYQGDIVFDTSYPEGANIKILDDQRFRELFPSFVFTDIQKGIQDTIQYYQAIL